MKLSSRKTQNAAGRDEAEHLSGHDAAPRGATMPRVGTILRQNSMKGRAVAGSDDTKPEAATNQKGYAPAYFAQKHRISLRIARALIKQFGNDRAALNEAAQYIRKV